MKRRGLLALLLLLAGLEAHAVTAIKLGYIGTLSGTRSQSAQRSLNALRLAAEDFNKRGGVLGRPVTVLAYDNAFSPIRLPALFRQALSDGVVGFAGVHLSNDGLLFAKLADEHRVPLVVASATHPDITRNRKFTVRVCFDDEQQAVALAKITKTVFGPKRVAVIVDVSDSFTDTLARLYAKELAQFGITPVLTLPIRTNTVEFSDVIQKLQASAPLDLIFLSVSALESSYFFRQAQTVGLRGPFLGSDGWQNSDLSRLLSNLGTSVEALFTAHWHVDIGGDISKRLQSNYFKAYGEKLHSYDSDAVLTYDAGTLLLTAIANAKTTDSAKVMAALHSIEMEGAAGSLHIGKDSTEKPIHVLEINNGKLSVFSGRRR